jgi:hypothetical protein
MVGWKTKTFNTIRYGLWEGRSIPRLEWFFLYIFYIANSDLEFEVEMLEFTHQGKIFTAQINSNPHVQRMERRTKVWIMWYNC